MPQSLHPELRDILSALRARRGFDPQKYIQAKVLLLNEYMRNSGLNAAVVGVSGGIDSAVVLALLAEAAKQPDSPIQRFVAALLPYFIPEGTTNQEEASARGREVAFAFNAECVLVDLSASHTAMKATAEAAIGITGDAWASGQLVTYLRTPALFYLSSVLCQERLPAIVVGTTNRDEGGYIGYFGKAGDAMVDLQLISDIHKSEVFEVGKLLGVPASVLEVAPAGDIYDGRTDEQLIGVPYDFLELFQLHRCLPDQACRERLVSAVTEDAGRQFTEWSARVETLNRECAHKYLGGSPAVHLDVYERAVPGGWRVEIYDQQTFSPNATKPDASPAMTPGSSCSQQTTPTSDIHMLPGPGSSVFVNEVTIDHSVISETPAERTTSSATGSATQIVASNFLGDSNNVTPKVLPFNPVGITREDVPLFPESAFTLHGLLSDAECRALIAELDRHQWLPVGQDGYLRGFDPATQKIGSYRASYFSDAFAAKLWSRIAPAFPILRVMDDNTPTDWLGDRVWRAVGINPLMRFIRYTQAGLLVPHYDAPFQYHPGKRTLMSLVLYLTDGNPEDGGATRFIVDGQTQIPLSLRDYKDWRRPAEPSEVLYTVTPKAADALVFDHRILHDSEPFTGNTSKIIMRTDVVFERCGLPALEKLTVSKPLGLPDKPPSAP